MSHHSCDSKGCGSHKHSGNSSGCGCGCNCESCDCSGCKCSCHGECDFSKELLQMADDAWMCLLKDKIKQKIEGLSGQHLNELADIVAKANHTRWSNKMKAKEASEDFEDQVEDFFNKH